MLRRAASRLVIGLSMLGGVAAVFQPYHATPVMAMPAPPSPPCTGVATTTGITTTLGYLTTSTISTITTTIMTWTTWWIEPPIIWEPMPAMITTTTTSTVPVTETTTDTVTTTGYVTTTDACPTTTTSSSSSSSATTTTDDPTTSTSTTTTTSASSSARPAAPAALSYVAGTVTHDGGQPLAGAVVTVGGVSDKTDRAGHYRAGPLGAGSYTVTITYPNGYTAASRSSYPVTLDGSNQATLNFYAVSPAAK